MSVNYKLIKNRMKSGEKTAYRAVTVEHKTVGVERIAQNIQGATALTRADVIATIAALRDEIAFQLMSGCSVHLPGIGYFSLAVKGDIYEDPRNNHVRLHNAEVRTVNFRPDTEMMDILRYTEFENATYRFRSPSMPTEKEIDSAIEALLAEKPYMTVDDLRDRLNLSQSTAYRITKHLCEGGRLRNIGTRYRKAYVRADKQE